MRVLGKTIKAKAEKIRQQYNVQEPPVNLFEIASGEGIEIIYFKPDENTSDISGLLNKDLKRVYLNVSESAARQNFTLAHELAHYFLNHKPNEYGVYRRDSFYVDQKPEKEIEADRFAAELLMPEELINKVKKTYELTDESAAVLSRLFGVSTSAMRYRLKELNRERQK
jgi:Zn-dependent peptidase ImmA (M78 family)